jgi:uncharacterized protein with PIN domain
MRTPPRFAVDKMLGRLATWLRLLGYDATYLRHARREGRIVLTRQRRPRWPTDLPVLFIDGGDFRAQVRQVLHALHLDPFALLFTRCTRCNQPVVATPRSAVAGLVPPYVLTTQEHFVRCPRCGRIYWPATHYAHVHAELRRMGFAPPPGVAE